MRGGAGPHEAALMTAPAAPTRPDPRRYHEAVDPELAPVAARDPVCLYLEATNRCNLLCTTCPRTYEELEPPADMTWELFTRIVDQVPDIARACCTASASRCWSRTCRDGALPEGPRRLRAVQHQRHGAQRAERPRPDRRRPRRAARVARRRQRQQLPGDPRQGLLRSHPAERAQLPRAAGARGPRRAAGLGLADGLARDRPGSCPRSSGSPPRSASRRSTCSASSSSRRMPSAMPAPTRRCSSS